MKLLLFHTYNQSFLSSFFKELALNLSERGYDVKIVSLKEKPEVIDVATGLTIQILKKRSRWQNYLSIFKLIKSERPDMVISNFSYVNPAILCGKLLGVKKNIVWFHTLTQQLNPRISQILLKSIFLKHASRIIVNSEYLKEDLENNYSIPSAKIFPIPFWSSLETKSSIRETIRQNATLKIGCPGRIEEVKNQQIIIDALADLDCNMPWRLYIAGRGSNEEGLKSKIQNYNLGDEVDLLGVLSIEKMQQYYKEMDLIIFPSKFEAFGLVLVEALSMGCPVLVSKNFGALTYIKDHEFLRKYTFDPQDPNSLKNRLENFICNREEPVGYFRNIYFTYFQKERIIAKVEEVINL